MQRGEQAPGWMAAYDERAGVIFGYRGLAGRAPKSLRIEADGSGEARVCLWHDGLPALAIGLTAGEAVFGAPHMVDIAPFTDEFSFAQPDRARRAVGRGTASRATRRTATRCRWTGSPDRGGECGG
jgi:hypothetical protein